VLRKHPNKMSDAVVAIPAPLLGERLTPMSF
jgi:hypothetical protein